MEGKTALGRSGCQLRFLPGSPSKVSKHGSSRLLVQGAKQRRLHEEVEGYMQHHALGTKMPCCIPKVHEIHPAPPELIMECITGDSLVHALCYLGAGELAQAWSQISTWIHLMLDRSHSGSLVVDTRETGLEGVLQCKLEQIKMATKCEVSESFYQYISATLHALLQKASRGQPTVTVPLGQCHGDFTLCNLMVTSTNQVYAVDCLDSFMESPIQDIAALLQDVAFHWCLLISTDTPPASMTHVRLALARLHHWLLSEFGQCPWWPLVPAFVLLKLMRILPYVTCDRERDWVVDACQHIERWSQPELQFDIAQSPESSPATTKTLILPVAGRSTRFPGVRPKWMLTHPSGKLMIEEAAQSLLQSLHFDRVILVVLQKHIDMYCRGSKELLAKALHISRLEICALPAETRDVVETVQRAVELCHVSGAVLVKDCDNAFAFPVANAVPNHHSLANLVCCVHTRSVPLSANKSSVSCSPSLELTRIMEKYPEKAGEYICVGGYGFQSDSVIRAFNVPAVAAGCGERQMSDLVFWSTLAGQKCQVQIVQDYHDWGTAVQWHAYRKLFSTWFVDIDGTLLYNSSGSLPPFWDAAQPIRDNVAFLQKIKAQCAQAYIVLTTSRAEEQRIMTTAQLQQYNVPFDYLLMGLPHSTRVLVNDFSATNPFPAAIAVNLPRDSTQLAALSQHILF